MAPKNSEHSTGFPQWINQDVWPQERTVWFRPDRLAYVRKLIKPEGCVFCKAVDDGVGFPSLVLVQTAHSALLLNKYPYNNGHLLVVPKRHTAGFMDMTEEEHGDLHLLLRRAVGCVQEAYQCQGLNIGINLGDVAGAGIPEHLHYHIVPRWRGDTNFMAVVAETKITIETLQQTYDKLKGYFEVASGK